MAQFTGTRYPNGVRKSRMYEVFLSYRDFGCSPDSYGFSLEVIHLEEQQGKENCSWTTDHKGRSYVEGLLFSRRGLKLQITADWFRFVMKAKVFISHASEDQPAAKRLFRDLRWARLDPWIAPDSLLPGQRWEVLIADAIRESDYFVALLSTKSVNKRGYVQKEIRLALDILEQVPERLVFLIPARLESCRPSHSALDKLQWVDLFPRWQPGIKKILQTIRGND